jgi:chemotaxis methyl-accepting protein methylase
MKDPATYEVLLRNIFRLVEDAELLLGARRYASANAIAIFALEEAGKYTAFLSAQEPPKKSKLHLFRQEVMGQYFKSAAIFEAFAREMEGMLRDLEKRSPESHAQATAMSRSELIAFAIDALSTDPAFDMDRFVLKVVGIDPSLKFRDEAKAGNYHRERQQSIHADYDDRGQLLSDPFQITEEQANRTVEMAWWAAELQKFWLSSWEKHRDEQQT